jgi:hypothetical protein
MDPRLNALGAGTPNCGYLGPCQRLLAIYGALAEASVFTSPNRSLIRTKVQPPTVLAGLAPALTTLRGFTPRRSRLSRNGRQVSE